MRMEFTPFAARAAQWSNTFPSSYDESALAALRVYYRNVCNLLISSGITLPAEERDCFEYFERKEGRL